MKALLVLAPVILVLGLTSVPAHADVTCSGPLDTACGPYFYAQSTWSNGYNTYVTDQDVGCGGDTSLCNDSLAVSDPGRWSLVAAMNDSATNCNQVHTYPDIQQLTQHADGSSVGLSEYRAVHSQFTISSPAVGSYEAAYDIWTSGRGSGEVMIWVDTQNHDHGETLVGTPVIFGQQFSVYTSGSKADPGEIIVKLDSNETSGEVHIKATLNWLISHGWLPAGLTISQINFGWEVCGTGGQPETFAVSSYSLTGVRA